MEINSLPLKALKVGQRESIEVNVSNEHVEAFVSLSGDCSPLHTDEKFAREQGFNGPLVQGLLIGAFISQLIGNRLPGRFGLLKSIDFEFRRPVIAPETLTILGEITAISEAVGQVTVRLTVTGRRGVVVANALAKSLVRGGETQWSESKGTGL